MLSLSERLADLTSLLLWSRFHFWMFQHHGEALLERMIRSHDQELNGMCKDNAGSELVNERYEKLYVLVMWAVEWGLWGLGRERREWEGVVMGWTGRGWRVKRGEEVREVADGVVEGYLRGFGKGCEEEIYVIG